MYKDLTPTRQSALMQMFFLEKLEEVGRLNKNRKIDLISIRNSVSPLNTDILPDDVRLKVGLKVLRELTFLKRAK